MPTRVDMWTYREDIVAPGVAPRNVVGYGVEATDGSIGKVDYATYEIGSSRIVVDTGPWIFGKKIMVDRSKDEIKHAPEIDQTTLDDEASRMRLGSYYDDSSR